MKIFEIDLYDLATIQVKVDNYSIEIIDIKDNWNQDISSEFSIREIEEYKDPTLSVQKLIDKLNEIEDKSLPVSIGFTDEGVSGVLCHTFENSVRLQTEKRKYISKEI